MKIFQTIKTSTPGTALETIPGLEVPALPEKIAKIDQAGSNDFQAKLGESFMKFREALILALRDPTSLGLGGDTKAAAGLPSLIPISLIQESSTLKVMTSSERNKLAGIETGAQVNTVTSVQGRIGSVVVNASDVGLGGVDNTSDMNKPVSTAQATAINARLPKLTYVGVSMNGASLTASVGKMYGIYATGVTITLPSATSIGDGEVIGFVIGVNASRTLQINTTANQDLVTPDGVKTTGYAVTGFARTVYAVCYFHTWMLCGLEDSAIDDAIAPLAPLASPALTGNPTAPTAAPGTNTTQLATTAFVTGAVASKANDADVVKTAGDQSIGGTKTFTSSPVLPTPTAGDDTTKAATTEFVQDAVAGVTASSIGLGSVDNTSDINKPVSTAQATAINARRPKHPYVVIITASTSIAAERGKTYGVNANGCTITLPKHNTAGYVDGDEISVVLGVSAARELTITSPSLIIRGTGLQPVNTPFNVTGLGTVISFVKSSNAWSMSYPEYALAGKAPLASPALTGTPTAPTAAAGTNTTQLATTAFVTGAVANNIPRWFYHYTSSPNVTAAPWRLQGFGASSTMTIPLASSVEEGTQVGALIVTGGSTVTLQRSGSDQFVTPTGLASSYTLQGNGNSIVLVRVSTTAWVCLSSPDAAIGVAMVGVKQSVPTTNVLTVTADDTVFLETEALDFSVFDKPVEVSFGCRCVGSVNLDLTVELYNPITSTSITLYTEASVPTNPLSIKSTIVKNVGNFDVLTTRLNDGASAVLLPINAAVSSASYKIRCICSVGSGGGTVSLFAPEVIITR